MAAAAVLMVSQTNLRRSWLQGYQKDFHRWYYLQTQSYLCKQHWSDTGFSHFPYLYNTKWKTFNTRTCYSWNTMQTRFGELSSTVKSKIWINKWLNFGISILFQYFMNSLVKFNAFSRPWTPILQFNTFNTVWEPWWQHVQQKVENNINLFLEKITEFGENKVLNNVVPHNPFKDVNKLSEKWQLP